MRAAGKAFPGRQAASLKAKVPHRAAMVHSHVLKGHPMTKYEKQGSGMPSHLCKGPPPTVNEPVWYGSKCRCCGELIG